MKQKQSSLDKLRILNRLPRNILRLQGSENVSEFVLHDLCSECFAFNKAAYFIDNPAFNCLKGVAGYNHDESYTGEIWQDPESFSNHMQSSSFNQKVRRCMQYSCKNCDQPDEKVLETLAHDLGMENFEYCSWDLKHENHGYLLYEKGGQDFEVEDLLCGLHLLSFCPVF